MASFLGLRLSGVFLVCACAAAAGGAGYGQTLEHRPATDAAAPAAKTDARAALPAEAEGEYRWGEAGEVIELYVEGGALHGYLVRRADRRDPNSAPLNFAFKDAGTVAGQLSFTTQRIHGDWYSFKGRVAPGAPSKEYGRYVLSGTLETHLGAAGPDDQSASDQPIVRQVNLKQSRQH